MRPARSGLPPISSNVQVGPTMECPPPPPSSSNIPVESRMECPSPPTLSSSILAVELRVEDLCPFSPSSSIPVESRMACPSPFPSLTNCSWTIRHSIIFSMTQKRVCTHNRGYLSAMIDSSHGSTREPAAAGRSWLAFHHHLVSNLPHGAGSRAVDSASLINNNHY